MVLYDSLCAQHGAMLKSYEAHLDIVARLQERLQEITLEHVKEQPSQPHAVSVYAVVDDIGLSLTAKHTTRIHPADKVQAFVFRMLKVVDPPPLHIT